MSVRAEGLLAKNWFTPQAIDAAGDESDWCPHPRVQARVTTRRGDLSPPPWQGFNLGLNCEDDRQRVLAAREQVSAAIGAHSPVWLTQVHGNRVITAPSEEAQTLPEADGAVTRETGQPCAVLTADCLPVLIARNDGSAVGALHAGWRGLLDGVLENGVTALAGTTADIHAWLGPAICCRCYQVDDTVREAFVRHSQSAASGFSADGPGHWRMDLGVLARQRLLAAGVTSISGGDLCTHCRADLFYSFRHEGVTGRFATIIWLLD
tara:strand:- start:221 stop:1015 length:795 start_codon:yes stop_codon:yes gene_type:complete